MIDTLQPTPQTGEFLQIFNRLCVALRDPGDDSGVTQQIYFDALKDLPLPAIDLGAANLMRESGRRFFPTTAEWRSAAELAQDALLRKALAPVRREPWRDDCTDCHDTGWVEHSCDGGAAEWPEARPAQLRGDQRHRGNRMLVGARSQLRATATPQPAVCGRERPHDPHDFVRVCPCRPTNRTYQRHQKFGSGE